MTSTFTADWLTDNIPLWKKLLAIYSNAPNILAIEIGVFEGRSTLWLLSEVLTHETSRIICIDPYCSPLFFTNIKPFHHKVQLIQEASQVALRDRAFAPDSVAFVYIDGDHKASSVLEDAILCFRLLVRGGILIFDDYLWKCEDGEDELCEPKPGIDAFLSIFKGKYNLLHQGWQVVIEKTV